MLLLCLKVFGLVFFIAMLAVLWRDKMCRVLATAGLAFMLLFLLGVESNANARLPQSTYKSMRLPQVTCSGPRLAQSTLVYKPGCRCSNGEPCTCTECDCPECLAIGCHRKSSGSQVTVPDDGTGIVNSVPYAVGYGVQTYSIPQTTYTMASPAAPVVSPAAPEATPGVEPADGKKKAGKASDGAPAGYHAEMRQVCDGGNPPRCHLETIYVPDVPVASLGVTAPTAPYGSYTPFTSAPITYTGGCTSCGQSGVAFYGNGAYGNYYGGDCSTGNCGSNGGSCGSGGGSCGSGNGFMSRGPLRRVIGRIFHR